MAVRLFKTEELSESDLVALRELVFEAFADDPEAFTDEDWQHALGGVHVILEEAGEPLAHGSVIERELQAGGHRLRTGYVEAVATRRDLHGRGYGSSLIRDVGEYIDRTFPLGALDTGAQAFYERLGWMTWKGPTYVRTESGLVRTAEDDGGVMVRLTPSSPELDLSAPITCEWRPGDVW